MNRYLTITLILISTVCSAQSAMDFYKRAVIKYKNKDFGGAITEYTRAIGIKDNSAVLYNNRGVCKYKMQRYSDAIEDYDAAIALDEGYADAHFNKGNSLKGIGEYQQALLSYDKTIQIDSTHRNAYFNRARMLYELGDYAAAVKDINKSLSLGYKQKQKAYLELGNCHLQLNKLEDALENYNRALALNENYYKAIVNRGQVYIKQGQYDLARVDFQKGMKLDPTSGECYFYRGLSYIYQIEGVKAKKKSKKTVKQIKDNLKLQQLACSDFEKSKVFGYSRALEAIQLYCSDK